ncbi:BET1-like protein [Rhopilema esculentum]|uniref:BET1-like protein n=1 Tax=Rhopilema esculentum TaxID=499914 RepID=UPI0031DC19F5|eukprot:gene12765-3497_t
MASRNGSSGRGGHTSDSMMEQENNRLASGLSSKISTLKNIALDIENEAKYQNSYLDGMGDDMETTSSLLGGSVKRLSHMISSGSSNRRLMCYLILIIVGAFFAGYYVLTRVKS